jgi:hypothetical protein
MTSISSVKLYNDELYNRSIIRRTEQRHADRIQEERRVKHNREIDEQKRIEKNRQMNQSGQNVDKLA